MKKRIAIRCCCHSIPCGPSDYTETFAGGVPDDWAWSNDPGSSGIEGVSSGRLWVYESTGRYFGPQTSARPTSPLTSLEGSVDWYENTSSPDSGDFRLFGFSFSNSGVVVGGPLIGIYVDKTDANPSNHFVRTLGERETNGTVYGPLGSSGSMGWRLTPNYGADTFYSEWIWNGSVFHTQTLGTGIVAPWSEFNQIFQCRGSGVFSLDRNIHWDNYHVELNS